MTVAAQRMELRAGSDVSNKDLEELYKSVGWTAYTRDVVALGRAIRNSSFVVTAWDGERLVGLVRAMSDDVSIAYLQDILVRPELHGKGIGKQLLETFLQRFGHVRQKVLLTDDRPGQLRFYERHGFHDVSHLRRTRLHAFVRMEDVELR